MRPGKHVQLLAVIDPGKDSEFNGQLLHTVDPAPEYVSTPQDSQTMLDVAPTCTENVPAAQSAHAFASDAPSLALYVPAGHSRQLLSAENSTSGARRISRRTESRKTSAHTQCRKKSGHHSKIEHRLTCSQKHV